MKASVVLVASFVALSMWGCSSAPAKLDVDASTPRPSTSPVGRIEAIEAHYGVSLRSAIPREQTVSLSPDATRPTHLRDEVSGTAISFRLIGTSPTEAEVSDGTSLYRGALDGADLIARTTVEGVEDYVAFDHPPVTEALTYDVTLDRVAFVRLVENRLELLDEGGSPRLRINAPFVVDRTGSHVGRIEVAGCSYDTDPSSPWDRTLVRPGSSHCAVTIGWSHVEYPALVDPSWVGAGTMSGTRSHFVSALLANGKVLVAGGNSNLTAAELYNPVTKTFAATGSQKVARSSCLGTLLQNGKVLLAGGLFPEKSAELYDPNTGLFTLTGSMSVTRPFGALKLLASGKVLVAGGEANASVLASAEVYDPAVGTFAATGAMTKGRGSFTMALLQSGKVLVAGGSGGNGPIASGNAELYDPGTGKFTATGNLLSARADHAMTTLPSGKVLVVGGSTMTGTASIAELYDPLTGTFAATGALVQGRFGAPSLLLASGKVLVAGGYVTYGVTNNKTAEIYNPATGTFTAITPMTTARDWMTLTLLASGRVLAAGGSVASAEELDLQVGTSCTAQQADNCVSGICKNGICCAKDCGPCNTCAPTTGACVPIATGDDAPACTGTNGCSAGVCKAKNGQACLGDGTACLSGFCADGVCCDTACNGGCDVCNALGKEGTCTVASKGSGGTNPSCSPYVCDGKANACPTSCSSLADCADGARCDTPTHTCVTGATCNDHVTTDADGVTADCTPYKCEPKGACRVQCTSIDDCVPPAVCDSAGKCSYLAPSTQDAGGCSTSGTSTAGGAWLALGLVTFLARLRQARRSATP